ncbi:RidA family protein [Mariluticola halotolerans]|uniref:RidA family protein n=1 Tax=Mariluticola halotolerans TaxID=2909283 RepID=UPI0026E1DFC9|nr:RidA family protein [Mariluticola halotolerans]UJQ95229.1 RidA family protein [Mariluticola halotolerans]
MSAEAKLKDLGHELSKPAAPAANYVPVNRIGDMLYVSGQISADANGVIKGTLGKDVDVAAGQKAASYCAVTILSHIANSAGVPLDEIKRVVKLTVLVASTPEFNEQHLVANGASDLLVAVLGDKGRHARAAFGVASLPFGAAVEIEAIVEV